MKHCGAVLLELLIALAIFVVAATTLLGTFSDVVASIGRDTTTARAVDLARSRMSELEAGLTTIEDLRAEAGRRGADVGGRAHADESEPRGAQGLIVDASITRSAYPGLTLVELRVFDATGSAPRFTLRQLVALPSERRVEQSIEQAGMNDGAVVDEVAP